MNEFDACVYRIIKLTYRVLAYEKEMGISESLQKLASNESFTVLKSLHERSVDYVNLISKKKDMDPANASELNAHEIQRIVLDFFMTLNELKSENVKNWLHLQHYMHLVYRNFTSPNPEPGVDTLDQFLINDMKELFNSLSKEDENQLYLRVFSLLREYTNFAYWQYTRNCEKELYVPTLYNYYVVFLNASKALTLVYSNFESVFKSKCNMTWMDFTKFIFYNYFYGANNVQSILKKCEQSEDINGEYIKMCKKMEQDFAGTNSIWMTLKNLIVANQETAVECEKILNKTFWMPRKAEEIASFDNQSTAYYLLLLASEKKVRGSDPLLGKDGQCLCEDCYLLKLGGLVENADKPFSGRYMPCKFCTKPFNLNNLHNHILTHANNEKEPQLKIASEPPVFCSNLIDISSKSDKDNRMAKTSIEDSEHTKEPLIKSSIIEALKLDKNLKTKIFQNSNAQVQDQKIRPTSESSSDENKENSSVRKNATKSNFNFPCGHSCKHDDEKSDLKKLHQGMCDHHKDSKKCDCTYCEVFGTSVASHVHKSSETRDRLRIRLNQRKQNSKDANCKSAMVEKARLANSLIKNGTIPNSKMSATSAVNLIGNKSTNPAIRTNISTTQPPTTKASISLNAVPSSKASTPLKLVQTTLKSNVQIKPGTNVKTNLMPTPKCTPMAAKTSNKIEIPTAPVKSLVVSNPTTKQNPNLLNDIHGILNYIEGNTSSEKMMIAQKKAAKKARQRQKKEEERQRAIEEERRKEEEERRKEEERLRLLRLLEKEKNRANSETKKNSKKKKNKENKLPENDKKPPTLIEETIPAMVTIKRVVESNDSTPTVTITLKGSTPDQDKLLYTLVNGYSEPSSSEKVTRSKKNKKQNNTTEQKSEQPIKLKVLRENQKKTDNGNNSTASKELKVTLAIDKKNQGKDTSSKAQKQIKCESETQSEIDFPLLRLPPGITITKVDGPVCNKNYRLSTTHLEPTTGTPVNKSGVIVVDTEKLIHKSDSKEAVVTSGRKSRRKKKKAAAENKNPQPPMVTLKNPIFQSMAENGFRENSMSLDIAGSSCAQASIFKNENGMVTIRSSRLQQSLNSGTPLPNLLSDLKPVIGGDVTSTASLSPCSLPETSISPFNAQEILSGLPGIEITKVDKKSIKSEFDNVKTCQTAQVSIIPTTNGEKCSVDKDDWLYDNVFTPKDILEDDMDADERELEAFKRFCQQSVPPKRKEKVAHLNVKDIVLKKKNDVSSV